MKRSLIFLAMLLTLSVTVHGQEWINRYYQNKRISDLNSEELSFLLTKANKTVTSGTILTCIGGGAVVLGGSILIVTALKDLSGWNYSGDAVYITALVMSCSGVIVALVGLPTLLVGLNRKSEITRALNNLKKSACLQIKPLLQYNRTIKSNCTGLTVCLRF